MEQWVIRSQASTDAVQTALYCIHEEGSETTWWWVDTSTPSNNDNNRKKTEKKTQGQLVQHTLRDMNTGIDKELMLASTRALDRKKTHSHTSLARTIGLSRLLNNVRRIHTSLVVAEMRHLHLALLQPLTSGTDNQVVDVVLLALPRATDLHLDIARFGGALGMQYTGPGRRERQSAQAVGGILRKNVVGVGH